MLSSARDYMAKNPWVGWALFFALLCVGITVYFLRSKESGQYTPESMKETLTIRFTDTDKVIKIPRGRLDKQLRGMGDTLDPTQGIINPDTGKPTGFLVDDKEWSGMIERINAEKAEVRNRGTAGTKTGKAVPRPQPALSEEAKKVIESGGAKPK